MECSNWQESQVVSQMYKDDVGKAHDIAFDMALTNGLRLKQTCKDQHPGSIKQGVKLGLFRS